MKIMFMGTPEFSVPVLEVLHSDHEVVAVYCQPPRPAGRGKQDRPSPVQIRAEALGLPVRHPVSLRNTEAQQELAAFGADIAVVVAYGLILPKKVLETPPRGCLNIHASLLPRWRGAAPIHRAVMAGDAETGICIMIMNEGLDTGPVLSRQVMPIGAQDTTSDLHDRLSAVGATLILQAFQRFDSLVPEAQPDIGITYAAKIDKAEARIDWTRSAVDIDRQIRALSLFPGAWCDVAGERLKLLRSRIAAGSGLPGQVLHGFTVACGQGAVEITLAQREGKRPALAQDLLRGFSLATGMRLG